MVIARNFKGEGWQTDKLGRWRSKAWRNQMRQQPPVKAPSGPGLDCIVAAHFRYPGCGIGARPADCLCYPMTDGAHKRAHNGGQPSLEQQWRWVTGTWLAAVRDGILVAEPEAADWLGSLRKEANRLEADLSTRGIEAIVSQWTQHFINGNLALAHDAWM